METDDAETLNPRSELVGLIGLLRIKSISLQGSQALPVCPHKCVGPRLCRITDAEKRAVSVAKGHLSPLEVVKLAAFA
jgi:hypothetical protein